MADSFLPYKNPDTTDKKLDSESLAVGANTVERERVQIAGKGDVEVQDVKNAPPANNAYGGVVRPVAAAVALATITGNQTATGQVGSTQDIGARFFALQLAGTWVGSVGLEESNDGVNFDFIGMQDLDDNSATGAGGTYTSSTINGIHYGYIRARYVRVVVYGYTSGTIEINCRLYAEPIPPTMVRVKIPSATSSPARQADVAYTAGELMMKAGGVANDAGTDFGADQDWVPMGLTRKGTGRQTDRPEILATISGNATATGVVGSQQDLGAKSVALQLTGTWSGTVVIEQSNDGTNWVSTILYDVAGSVMGGSGGVFTGITLNGIFIANIYGRYVRVRVSTYASGTIAITAILWGESISPSTIKIIPHSATTTGLIKQEDAAHGSGDVGVFVLGVRNDNGATAFGSANGDYIPFGVDNAGAPLTPAARPTGGGLTQHKRISTADTNAVSLKASAGQIYAIQVYNTHATDKRFLKLYNKASAPTVGTDVPTKTITIGPGQEFRFYWDVGLPFATGIAYAITSWLTDADSGGIGANEVVLNIDYI